MLLPLLSREVSVSDVASKLEHLLPHWLEHSEAHAESYRLWADRAREADMDAVAEALDEVLGATEVVHRALREAVRALGTATK